MALFDAGVQDCLELLSTLTQDRTAVVLRHVESPLSVIQPRVKCAIIGQLAKAHVSFRNSARC